MYVHLGNRTAISDREIIGVFDIENTSVSHDTRQYLKRSTDEHKIVNVSFEMPKSFIVCSDRNGNETVYISQISVATLWKRSKNGI